MSSLLRSVFFKAPGHAHGTAPAASTAHEEHGAPVEELREEDFPTLWKEYFDDARDIPLRTGTPQEAVCFSVLLAALLIATHTHTHTRLL